MQNKIKELTLEIKKLKQQLYNLNGTGKPCPLCGIGMVKLTTYSVIIDNKRSHGCYMCHCNGKSRYYAHQLKPGQKSVLVQGLIG